MLLHNSAGSGKADVIPMFAKGFSHPYGLAYHQGEVLVPNEKPGEEQGDE
jgi:glucose/arabinose dehydrogenase